MSGPYPTEGSRLGRTKEIIDYFWNAEWIKFFSGNIDLGSVSPEDFCPSEGGRLMTFMRAKVLEDVSSFSDERKAGIREQTSGQRNCSFRKDCLK